MGYVNSEKFYSVEKIFFGHFLGQYWTPNTMYCTWACLNRQIVPIYHFRVILGRKFQICWEKFFWTTPWASTGLVLYYCFNKNLELAQRVVQKSFSLQNRILPQEKNFGIFFRIIWDIIPKLRYIEIFWGNILNVRYSEIFWGVWDKFR